MTDHWTGGAALLLCGIRDNAETAKQHMLICHISKEGAKWPGANIDPTLQTKSLHTVTIHINTQRGRAKFHQSSGIH